jgi:poly-gamma-glutamate synthesis protein (capsule biosynthesis protein)
MTLFLCGDLMTGRGIDQILPHPGEPRLYEPYVKDSRDYVALAERAHGPIPRPADFAYVWGDARGELDRAAPDARIVNLETAITAGGEPWPGKDIHYRMHPANTPCLTAARIDVCVLANNHLLDWGRQGLLDTLEALAGAGIRTAGAGRNRREAEAPAILEIAGKGRILVFAFGCGSSGVPGNWAAAEDRPGVSWLPDLSAATAQGIAGRILPVKRPGDLVLASIHWGGNWGYRIPEEQRAFAKRLIDEAAVDILHGHSSHHPKGIEVHNGRPIFYGCGDFLTDYEGIAGYQEFRSDLALMYFVTFKPANGKLLRLGMTPLRTRRFRLGRPAGADVHWLHRTLTRECGKLGAAVELTPDGRLLLRWS